MTITFLRVRPAEALAEPTAVSRRREGTTTVEMSLPAAADLAAAEKTGLLVVAETVGDVEPAAWVVSPADALALADKGVPPWRITVVAEGGREAILDAVARSRAPSSRRGSSRIADLGGAAPSSRRSWLSSGSSRSAAPASGVSRS